MVLPRLEAFKVLLKWPQWLVVYSSFEGLGTLHQRAQAGSDRHAECEASKEQQALGQR